MTATNCGKVSDERLKRKIRRDSMAPSLAPNWRTLQPTVIGAAAGSSTTSTTRRPRATWWQAHQEDRIGARRLRFRKRDAKANNSTMSEDLQSVCTAELRRLPAVVATAAAEAETNAAAAEAQVEGAATDVAAPPDAETEEDATAALGTDAPEIEAEAPFAAGASAAAAAPDHRQRDVPIFVENVDDFLDFLEIEDTACRRVEAARTLVVSYDHLSPEQQQRVRNVAIPLLLETLDSDEERAKTKAEAAVLEIACCDSQVLRNLVVEPIAQGVLGGDPAIQRKSALRIAWITSACKNPPIKQFVDAGVVPRLVGFLQRNDDRWLQNQTARTLHNMAEAGEEHTNVVVGAGAIAAFVQLLSFGNESGKQEAALGLANIVKRSQDHRDSALREGAMPPLLAVLRHQDSSIPLLEDATRALANFYRWKHWPGLNPTDQQVLDDVVVPKLVNFLQRDEDVYLQGQAARALKNMAWSLAEQATVVVQAGAIPAFVRLLGSPFECLKKEAARGLEIIAASSPNHRDSVLQEGAMPPILSLLTCRGTTHKMLRRATRTLAAFCNGKPRSTFKPVDLVVQAGVVRKLSRFLQRGDDPDLQFEAVRALTSVAAGGPEHAEVIVKEKAITGLIQLLHSQTDRVKDVAAEALAKFARINSSLRDVVLQEGAMPPLLALLRHRDSTLELLRIVTWALSRMCDGDPRPKFELIRPALPAFAILITRQDEDILRNVCWAFNYLTGGSEKEIQEVISAGVCPRLIELLGHPRPEVHEPAILSVGRILTCSTQQAKSILHRDLLPSLHVLLDRPIPRIQGHACWCLSCFLLGGETRVSAVFDGNIVPSLIQLLGNSDRDIRTEATRTIWNITATGTVDQIEALVEAGCIPPLCGVLTMNEDDSEAVSVALKALDSMLHVGWELQLHAGTPSRPRSNPMVVRVASSNARGRSKLRELRRHPDEAIRKHAHDVLLHYFGVGDDDEWDVEAAAEGNGGDDGVEPPRQRPRLA